MGAASAVRLAEDGVEVIRFDLSADADVVVDVSDAAAVDAAVARAGGADILLNCAGIVGPNMPLWEVDGAAWDRVFAVNVRGTFNLCHAVVPGMRERHAWACCATVHRCEKPAGSSRRV